MPRVETIVVGGGVGATSPFTVNALTYITATDPPTVGAISISKFVTGANQGIIIASGATDPQPTATELLRISGGAIIEGVAADSVTIGRGASSPVAATLSVAIGRLATVDSSNNVAIGNAASATSTSSTAVGGASIASGNLGTAFGQDARAAGGGGSGGATAIGQASRASNTFCTAVGNVASATGIQSTSLGANTVNAVNGAVAVGAGANCNTGGGLAIGFNAAATGTDAIAIGGATAATAGGAHTVIIGGGSSATSGNSPSVVIGTGLAATAANQCWLGTGNTILNTFILGRGDTHTSAHAITLRATNMSGTNVIAGDVTIIASRGTGSAATGGEIIFQTGAPGAGGVTLQTATTQFRILKSAGGAAAPNVRFDNVTSGAAASAGTLTNAPSVGNPSFWLPVNIAGNVRYIPCWT